MAAKKLSRRLCGLGAVPLLLQGGEPGLGDDQHPSGYEAALDRWLPQVWARLRAAHPLPPGVKQVGGEEGSWGGELCKVAKGQTYAVLQLTRGLPKRGSPE